ncbi:GH32 C-terminal domain-containing protein [Lentisphaera profundi]|uniref:GH32 C-terminal domain-containing protein n=1 Tax=Lentisphaera profundi TaxID=1658616 RepID=A0ABY7VWZ8_9BACT|nr:GH32 C-terminal domain-containing protein [Lentisphaera profundi]WDE97720.1 GH32 C-terminal domain-containing protein [Lentisphaera profundi]
MMVWARFKPADPQAPFNQGFTLPLEISLRTSKDGVRSYANPVDELKVLRDKKILTIEDKALLLGENTLTFDKSAKLIELEMTLDYPLGRKPSAIYLQVGQTKILCDLAKNKFHGAKGKYSGISSYDKEDGKLDLRIYIDSATLETFAENGAVYFIHNRTDQGAALNDIKIHVEDGEVGIESLNVYELKSISGR